MSDPLAEVVSLLQPGMRFSKVVGGAGRWGVRRAETGQPSYCVVLDGSCRLVQGAQGHSPPLTLLPGDFVLIPAAREFAMTSIDAPDAADFARDPVPVGPGEFRLGTEKGDADVRFIIGHCSFGSPDAGLLVALLPQRIHVRGEPRLETLVRLVGEESRAQRPAREVVMARLLEVLLIEALRASVGAAASPGLLRGLGDARLAAALRRMHDDPTRAWTVAELARAAALSRSAFFERFSRAVGVAPMAYLLGWRMALAKQLLRHDDCAVAEVAARVGYGSASTFSVAFARYVGMPPARYARASDRPPEHEAA